MMLRQNSSYLTIRYFKFFRIRTAEKHTEFFSDCIEKTLLINNRKFGSTYIFQTPPE